ncbi:MAG: DUF2148 domain-containing protein [Clostridia bacterium]|nr:DUF2148 domain-containing protein [Clostridia bacterium]
MILDSKTLEMDCIMRTASRACTAARTAPKTRGIDNIHTCVVNAEELNAIADEMDRLNAVYGLASFKRDAQNVRSSDAVVLIGTIESKRGLNAACGYCHHENCAACEQANGTCVYDAMDLGIALGSAVSIISDDRVDNRIMFSIGKAALSLGMMPPEVKIAMGIPLSVKGKNPFFDRK